jgi:hypothetical protein
MTGLLEVVGRGIGMLSVSEVGRGRLALSLTTWRWESGSSLV